MKTIDVIVETPRGSAVKYDLDSVTGFFKLKKELPAGMVFPHDFGFIPHTKGEDGDPLDVVVISEFGNFPGCLVECKLIGSMRAKQKENKGIEKPIRNDRFLAIPVASRLFKKINDIDELPKHVMEELEAFFVQYNKMEGRTFVVTGTSGPGASFKLIKSLLTKK